VSELVETVEQAEPRDVTPSEPAQAAPDAELAVPEQPAAAPEEQPHGDPVAAVIALRRELQELKPVAKRAQEMEAALNDARPYVEFLKAHPELLRPQQAAPQPAKEPDPQDDPALVGLAQKLELYDASTGKPDTARAAEIRNMMRAEAQAIAKQEMAPVTERTHQTQLQANLQWMSQLKDADGRPLEGSFINSTLKAIYGALPEKEALRVLADPHVAEVVGYTALGRQAASKKSAPKGPASAPLHVETAGGGSEIALSESSKKLARLVGKSDKEWTESAKRFKPNSYNSLE